MYKKYRGTLELFLAILGDRPGHDIKQRELEDCIGSFRLLNVRFST
jgi:hypothetical protein